MADNPTEVYEGPNRRDRSYSGPERRRSTDRVTIKNSFQSNPALILLLVFNVVITGLAIAGIAATNHRAQQSADKQTELTWQNRRGILFICRQFEAHRIATARFHEANAIFHGFSYTIPGSALPPEEVHPIEQACKEFRDPALAENGPVVRGVGGTSTTQPPPTAPERMEQTRSRPASVGRRPPARPPPTAAPARAAPTTTTTTAPARRASPPTTRCTHTLIVTMCR